MQEGRRGAEQSPVMSCDEGGPRAAAGPQVRSHLGQSAEGLQPPRHSSRKALLSTELGEAQEVLRPRDLRVGPKSQQDKDPCYC